LRRVPNEVIPPVAPATPGELADACAAPPAPPAPTVTSTSSGRSDVRKNPQFKRPAPPPPPPESFVPVPPEPPPAPPLIADTIVIRPLGRSHVCTPAVVKDCTSTAAASAVLNQDPE